ncbi:DUF4097 family beta strand repeat protein [candidate division KSB1 bacterium]|nr:DUF4097 family beta strand repeat protein [candidate division KSB1 bacterium]MBL7094619.1 DUF4097 family beta strand repeat protein [candidate division KSB1 bacterium]
MKKKHHLISLPFILIATFVTLIIFFSCEQNYARDYEDKISKSFKVKKGQLFYLKSDMGSVEVESWNRNEVKIVVIKKAKTYSKREAERAYEDLELRFDQNRRGVSVIAEYTGPKRWSRRKLNVRFEILVPREFDLDISTAGGSISVEDLEGKIDLHTSGGSITIGRIEGPVNARTSGGSIRVTKARGDVDVHTSGGSISIGETSGSLDAETSGGSITLDGVDGDTHVHTSGGGLKLKNLAGNVQGSTSGGSIYAELTGRIDRDCYLKTSGGGITVYLPDNINAEIDAHTSGGRVSTDFPITVRGKLKSNTLYGKINDGGPIIKLRTSGGGIRIKEF